MERSGKGDYKLIDWSIGGLLKTSWIRLAKIACLEKSDIIRKLGHLGGHDKDIIADIWNSLYKFPQKT